MSASIPSVDRPVPSVAIVGTDAVLAAAPATPVQLAHACLRRGFTVAVPASWGDELIAAETLRRLATKERGPAVMCVCPLARARLLAPGPDLARFLVSLVSPPVAAARYIRSAYGSQDVHITYIGTCPGADDPSIDARLTPDAFIADLAEHGIALAEQPLVFDSIVPPDRRRWCSQPGGIPNAESLHADPDARSVIEMDRDDVTTELAEHILAREHMLLDLAPSLGCACSGAIGAIAPNRARSTVMAAEPPRAFSPVIDPATPVSLDVPVAEPASSSAIAPAPTAAVVSVVTLERVLDELLGAGPLSADTSGDPSPTGTTGAVILDLPALPAIPVESSNSLPERPSGGESDSDEPPADYQADDLIGPGASDSGVSELETHPTATSDSDLVSTEIIAVMPPGHSTDAEVESVPLAARTNEGARDSTEALGAADVPPGIHDASTTTVSVDDEISAPLPSPDANVSASAMMHASNGASDSLVRRRTPPATLRYPASSVPKATVADGRPLPRAYVAKRRTPPGGAATISADDTSPAAAIEASEPSRQGELVVPLPLSIEPDTESATSDAEQPEPIAAQATASASEPPVSVPASSVPNKSKSDPVPTEASSGAGRAAAHSATHPALMLLLVAALIALALFVLLTLRQ